MQLSDLTIVIPFYNGHQYLDKRIRTLPEEIPIIIVDDKSKRPLTSDDLPDTNHDITIIPMVSKGYFAGAINTGITACNTDVLILNQDTYFTGDEWFDILDREYGMIGERIRGNRPDWPNGYIHGTFMWLNRDAINDVGLFNEEVYPLWGCTAEWQLRACRHGYKVKPLKEIPGFVHLRPKSESYGSSIKQLLREEWRDNKHFVAIPPEISVVIPCHNFGKYLPDAINSLIGGETCLGKVPGQTFQGFEIVIVDDGSDDHNKELIRSVLDPWKGIRGIVLKRNPVDSNGKYIGKPVALNLGINAAKGKYITVLDADDMMTPERLEILWRTAKANPHSVIYDDIQTFKNGQITKSWRMATYDFDQIAHKNTMHIGIFYPKLAWQEIGGYAKEMEYGREDWAFNVGLGLAGWCGVHANIAGYLYRREGQNRTIENTTPKWRRRFYKQIQDLYPNYYLKGEVPMACCGRGGTNNKTSFNKGAAVRSKAAQLPGVEGKTQLIYTGSRMAAFSLWGVKSGLYYRIRPGIPFAAANEDLETGDRNKLGLLEYTEAGKHVLVPFKRPQEKPKADTGILPPVTEEKPLEGEIEPLELESITVLRKSLREKEYSDSDLNNLLVYEIANKNRKGAIKLLEEALEDA